MRSLFILVLVLFLSLTLTAQEDKKEEITSSVPELFDFHEIIYPIWHTAYPEKDYAALKGFVPDINKGSEKIYNAALPGILRDKEAKWKEGLALFKASVEDYNKAAEGDDNEALLKAAENLHSNFEMMVRIIKPVIKEVDEFHKELYVVYHYYLPEKNISKIKEVSGKFVEKSEAVKNAKLSARVQKKEAEFKQAAGDLYDASVNLNKLCASEGNDEEIISSVEVLHTKYQALEAIFD